MSTVLITGSTGQLGQALTLTKPRSHPLTAIYAHRKTIDLTQPSYVRSYIKAHAIQWIVNCAAYTAVDQAEIDRQTAYAINAAVPTGLGNLAQELGFVFLHISTDYVFEGKLAHPMDESMPTAPVNYYGYTKLMGEQGILAYQARSYIIRTGWLYSHLGNNSLTRLYQRVAQGDPLRIVYDQVGSPTYALDLATAIWHILDQLYQAPDAYRPGIYHYANQGVASRYDFAWNVCKGDHRNVPVLSARTSDFPGYAARPAYSVLDTRSIQKTFGLTLPHWQDSLSHCLYNLNNRNSTML
jgi:dTDP-4-dehydrorhamnose reductase